MTMTIKEVIDQALGEVNHPTEPIYFGGTNNVITAIANRSASSLSQEFYSILKTEGTITMTSELAYPLPSDFRYLVPDSMNAQDIERHVQMPTSNKEWHYLKSQTNQSGIQYKCRIFGGNFNFEYVESGQVINYEYITKNHIAVKSSLVPNKERFTLDTDYYLLDDNLLILDIVWRYSEVKGIEGWQVKKQIFDDYKKTHFGNESGSGTIDMSGGSHSEIPSPHYPSWQ